ncbi:MAG: hypothetical protein H0X30_23060 [Anaerolineae bacterium]|nr:hypothetical protein [Anaerolineae bacterium]
MPPLETIYLIHHSHTDIGYTYDQPILWEMDRRFIDEAIDLCEQYDDTEDHAYRWNIETVAPLLYWLKHSSDKQIERLVKLEKARRIEIAGMYANMTPLVDSAEWIELMQPLHGLRKDYGFTIRNAMNCDVNGHNWTLTDALLDAGITGFSMAINEHSGGAPLNRPNLFKWQAPSGRTLNTLNGWHYVMGNFMKIGESMEGWETFGLPFLTQKLESLHWPFPMVNIQLTNPYGDNSGVYRQLPEFIKAWNAKGLLPRMRFATLQDWWSAAEQHSDKMETVRGDWTDFWNYGGGSSARESTLNRASRSRLVTADSLYSAVETLPQTPAQEVRLSGVEQKRQEAWHALAMYDEHTWGADLAVWDPNNEDAATQWYHKGIQAHTARSLSLMLQRDGIAELAQSIPAQEGDALVVYNPTAWARRLNAPIPATISNETLRGMRDDANSSRHHQDRSDFYNPTKWWLPDAEIPAFGYTVIKRDQLVQQGTPQVSDVDVVENDYHRLTFDKVRGGLKSWYDKTLGRELIDSSSDLPFGGVIYERPAEPAQDNPRRTFYKSIDLASARDVWVTDWKADRWSAKTVTSHEVIRLPIGWRVTQTLTVPELASPVTLRVFLPDSAPWVEIASEWSMGLNPQPEATYVAMPFALSKPIARFDIGGVSVEMEKDQIPNCCKDYFTVQNWADLSTDEWGVTVACPENPMVMFGDFTYGHDIRNAVVEKGLFLGWTTNNYWETNFRAHQPGKVTARYIVQPHKGSFDEQAAHRFGMEQCMPIIAQSRFEHPLPEAKLPRSSSLLELPQSPVLTLHVLPDEEGAVVIRLLNASDSKQEAVIGSGLLKIERAEACNLFGQPLKPLSLNNGSVTVEIEPRRTSVIRLGVRV